MDKFTEGLRKFALAGMGAISYTAEKSKELIDRLAARGEITASEGAAACDELREKLSEQVNSFTAKLRADYENITFEHMLERCASLSAEQKARLLERLTAREETPETVCGESAEPSEAPAADLCETVAQAAPSEEADLPSEE